MSYRFFRQHVPGPQEIAECGGPCKSGGAAACDCQVLQELAGASQWEDKFFRDLFEGVKRRKPIYAPLPVTGPHKVVGYEAVDPAEFGRAVIDVICNDLA